MNVLYNAATQLMSGALKLYSRFLPAAPRRKFPQYAKGQQGLMQHIEEAMARRGEGPTVWFHAASLGEYQVARPLISALKKQGPCNIVMTFFSPTGYRALEGRHPEIDFLFYLPLDTPRAARRFVETVSPDKAVFIISEFWPNMLQQLKFNAVPTYLVSALIRDDSQFFRWYGRTYRRALSAFTRIFVLNESSRFNLRMLGYTDVSLSGDPLFDNAYLVANTPWQDAVIEKFKGGEPMFVAGSISDENDARLVCRLIEENPDTRFLLVPHEIKQQAVDALRRMVGAPSALYTESTAETDFSDTKVLILNTVGKLAYVYRYATWAYVGGGFTPLLHSVIEAMVYGVPVSFGPMIQRKVTPNQLIDLGLGAMVKNPDEIADWFASLKTDTARLDEIRRGAAAYVEENIGGCRELLNAISSGLWQQK